MVLTPIPQADGTTKNRPAIILREMPRYRLNGHRLLPAAHDGPDQRASALLCALRGSFKSITAEYAEVAERCVR